MIRYKHQEDFMIDGEEDDNGLEAIILSFGL